MRHCFFKEVVILREPESGIKIRKRKIIAFFESPSKKYVSFKENC